MEVTLERVSKRFARHWVFKNLSLQIAQGSRLAITGPNGSGKSTLLKIICGALPHSNGNINYYLNQKILSGEQSYRHISFAAPYSQVIEEFTLSELLAFHMKFKSLLPEIESVKRFVDLLQFTFKRDVAIRNYSSGMKQRIRLALAICSVTNLLLLDEPGSNLDAAGKAWLQSILTGFSFDRTIIIASNDSEDYLICDKRFDMEKVNPG